MMRVFFSFLSVILAILSLLPWIFLQYNEDFYSILTFGLSGWFSAVLPFIYAILSFLIAFMAEPGKGKFLAFILSTFALLWNIVILIAALIL